MKTKRSNIFTRALNTASDVINTASGVFQELTLPPGERQIRYCLSPYGEFPVDDVNGRPIMQVIDRGVGETLALNFGSLRGQFATFFRGIPIYEGHADDPAWLAKNPGHKATAVGRIKAIEPEDDGIYATAVLNAAGVELLGGEAPQYSGHSPHWRLSQIPGQPGRFKPVLLWSDALTNTPNIMTNTIALNSLAGVEAEVKVEISPTADTGDTQNQDTEDMKLTPEALAALGFAPDAMPSNDEISAAVLKTRSDIHAAETATTAANSRATLMETELNLIRGTAVEVVITEAINTGRIAEGEREQWATALNTSFATEAEKIRKLMPVLNTASKLPDLSRQQGQLAAGDTEALNTAVRTLATENGLDLTKRADYDKAWDMLRTAKPELFARN